ncbi:MAG TPA: glutaredoxin domain-containing protein [Bacteriovoracaceae bacterium]|nr:glutaredoxin domain-containing protein [Bacteriovoracaceae bacterium]
MNRTVLSEEKVTPEALAYIAGYHQEVVNEVARNVGENRVVVIGMAQNPFVKKVRCALKDAKVEFKYLEYGNYMSQWKQRLAIKLWSGWPTYPQVFVDGKLVGGFQDTKRLIESGKLK